MFIAYNLRIINYILKFTPVLEMDAELNIKAAIEFYNENRGSREPLNSRDLALMIFSDKKSSDRSKIVLFYQIINNRRRFVDIEWLAKISQITGFPPEKLIIYSQKPVNYGKEKNDAPELAEPNERKATRES